MPRRILIVKLSSMGDVLHALPAAQALRALWPDAHLAWAVQSEHAPLVERQPWLDEVVVWKRRGARNFTDFIRRLRHTAWDVAIDLQNILRSAVVTRLSGAPRRVGLRPSRELAHWFYNDGPAIAYDSAHAVDVMLGIAEYLGADVTPLRVQRRYLLAAQTVHLANTDHLAKVRPRIEGHVADPSNTATLQRFPLLPAAADLASAEAWLARTQIDPRHEQLVAINPDCRRSANRWPVEKFRQLVARLVELPGVRVALIGGVAARPLCDAISQGVEDQVARADGQLSLLASTVLLQRARLLVTGDTGPMHLAVAVETPVVALIGATDPMRTGPYTENATVLRHHLECSPCQAKHCPLKYDPPRCMDAISVDEAYQAVVAQLAATERSSALWQLASPRISA